MTTTPDDVKQAAQHAKRDRPRSTVSLQLPDGTLVEMVHDPDANTTQFCVANGDDWRFVPDLVVQGERCVPYSPGNNLLRHHVVLLPSAPEEYESDTALVASIRAFIHRYIDLSPVFQELAVTYILLTWLYDRFNELPYLRVRGDAGSGKTRFLLVVGSLCYKPIFASGASTVSPLFRILDSFRGTLILDESDFRVSDERAEIVKILNNGNARGFPVLRSEQVDRKEFDPRAYAVFGPKLVATRGFFDDRALESRCLTEEMGQGRLRTDIPINLPDIYQVEARHLRNQLLLFRFRHWHRDRPTEAFVDRGLEPRLNQIFTPLLAVLDDEDSRAQLRAFAGRMQRQTVSDRGLELEARVLEIIRALADSPEGERMSVKAITQWFADRFGEEYDAKVTTKWIGAVIRKKLLIRTQKSHGVFVIPPSEYPQLAVLYEKYGIGEAESTSEPGPTDPWPGVADGPTNRVG
jgi:hypothetical protein